MIRIAIVGATGRMGTRLLEMTGDSRDVQVVAALAHPSDPRLGQPAGHGHAGLNLAAKTDAAAKHLEYFREWLQAPESGQLLQDRHAAGRGCDMHVPRDLMVALRGFIKREASQESMSNVRAEEKPSHLTGQPVDQALAPAGGRTSER